MEEVDEVIGYDGISTEKEKKQVSVPSVTEVKFSQSRCKEECGEDKDKAAKLKVEVEALGSINGILGE